MRSTLAPTIVNIPYREFVHVKLWFENNVTADGTLAPQQAFPANFRPLVPCSIIIALRSSNGVANQLASASRFLLIG